MEKEIEKLNKQKMNEFKYEFLELYTNDINKKLQKETTGSLQIENDCIILKSTKYNTKKSYHFFSTINFDDFLSIKQTKLSPSIFYILHISLKQKKYDQIIDTFSNAILKKMQTVPFTINSEYAIDLIPYAEELFEQRNNVFVRSFIDTIYPNQNYKILANNYKCNCIQLKNNMLSITKNEDRFVLDDCLMKTQLELIPHI